MSMTFVSLRPVKPRFCSLAVLLGSIILATCSVSHADPLQEGVKGVKTAPVVPKEDEARGNIQIGDTAPKVVLEGWIVGPSNGEFRWDTLRGEVVVLEFWTTWCVPCVSVALPHLNELADQVEDLPVTFVAISNEPEHTVRRFLDKKPMRSWIGVDTDSSVFGAYGIDGIPRTIVIGPTGRIAAVTYPTRLTRSALEAVLCGEEPGLPPPPSAQSTETAPAAPAARLRVELIEHDARPARWGMSRKSGRFSVRGQTVRTGLAAAVGLIEPHILGPEWLGERYVTLEIKAPEAVIAELVCSTIEHGYEVRIDRERRTLPVLVLETTSRTARRLAPSEPMGSVDNRPGTLHVLGASLGPLVGALQTSYGMQVVDETGLAATYDYQLVWDPADPSALIRAVEEQLAIRIVREERPVDVLVVHPR